MFKKPSKSHPSAASGINPLDEIRQAEAKASSQVLLARHEAEELIQASKSQALQIIQQAQQEGAQAGQSQYKALIHEAAQESEQITAQARRRVELHKEEWKPRAEKAARWALKIVLGLDEEELKP